LEIKQSDTLSNAKLVLLTGGSAGGLGVIANFVCLDEEEGREGEMRSCEI
jgi:hypothetical protein